MDTIVSFNELTFTGKEVIECIKCSAISDEEKALVLDRFMSRAHVRNGLPIKVEAEHLVENIPTP